MATHSSLLAWRIPWAEEPGELQSMGSQRSGHEWVTKHTHTVSPPWFCQTLMVNTSIMVHFKAMILILQFWVNSGSWWWTGRPGVLRFMGSQRVGHDWATDLIWSDVHYLDATLWNGTFCIFGTFISLCSHWSLLISTTGFAGSFK